jgi:two-component system KDP operon response regulator KdpE
MPGRILIIDDEPQITRVLRAALSAQGYDVRTANDPEEGLQVYREWPPDLVVTDLMMPGLSGVEVTRAIRARAATPVLILSVRDHERSKVEALDAGADDYITKPFHLGELTARLRAAVRRGKAPDTGVAPIMVGDVHLDPERHLVQKNGRQVHLTPKQFELLQYLMTNAGKPVPHAKLLRSVWGPEYGNELEYLRTFIRQIRVKIEDDPANPRYLLTESHIGYRFSESV